MTGKGLGRVGIALALATVWGCDLPREARGATDRIRGGWLRVGVTDNPPWAVVGNDGRVAGIEATLAQRIADRLEARDE